MGPRGLSQREVNKQVRHCYPLPGKITAQRPRGAEMATGAYMPGSAVNHLGKAGGAPFQHPTEQSHTL
jgi:hypothetical protein